MPGSHIHDRLFQDRPAHDRPYAEVIGDPISHSKSPVIHGFWIEKLGMTADYRATQVSRDDLRAYLANRTTDKRWRGCNVTMPHKVAVMEHIALAQADMPSVNTIFRHRFEVPVGASTDGSGFWIPLERVALEQGFPILQAVVQVIGAGGAARAVLDVLLKKGVTDIRIYNRSPEAAQEIARRFEIDPARVLPLQALAPVAADRRDPMNPDGLHLIVNASSLGMRGHPPIPIDMSLYPPQSIAYDLVYDPVETDFLRAARDNGLVALDGLQMLVEQARQSFTMFFKKQPPRQYDDELRELLLRR